MNRTPLGLLALTLAFASPMIGVPLHPTPRLERALTPERDAASHAVAEAAAKRAAIAPAALPSAGSVVSAADATALSTPLADGSRPSVSRAVGEALAAGRFVDLAAAPPARRLDGAVGARLGFGLTNLREPSAALVFVAALALVALYLRRLTR